MPGNCFSAVTESDTSTYMAHTWQKTASRDFASGEASFGNENVLETGGGNHITADLSSGWEETRPERNLDLLKRKASRNGRWGAEEPTLPSRTHPSATAVPKATEQDSFKCYCCPFHYKPCQKGDWWNLNKTKQAEPHAKPYSPFVHYRTLSSPC